jgi:hypothetical protein
MATLKGTTISETYPLLLKVESSGVDGTLRNIEDGDGTASALKISSGAIQVDNIKVDGNAITSTDSNGNIDLTPNGSGEVNISKVDIDSGTINGTTITSSVDIVIDTAGKGLADEFGNNILERTAGGYITIGDSAWNEVRLNTTGSTDFVLDNSGRIGIGTTSPSEILHLSTTGATTTLQISSGTGSSTTGTSQIYFSSKDEHGGNTHQSYIKSTIDGTSSTSATKMTFHNRKSDGTVYEYMSINNDGRTEISGSNGAELRLSSQKTSIGGTDPLGTIQFRSRDSNNDGTLATISTIMARPNASHTTNITGEDGEHTEMIFRLGDDTGSGIEQNMKETLRLRGDAGNFACSIDAHGAYGLSINAPSASTSSHDVFTIVPQSGSSVHTMYGDGSYRNTGGVRLQGSALSTGDTGIASSGSGGDLLLYSNGSAYAKLNSLGNFGINTASPTASKLHIEQNSSTSAIIRGIQAGSGDGIFMKIDQANASAILVQNTSGVNQWYIQGDGDYDLGSSLSDKRMKLNIESLSSDINYIDKINLLNPVKYNKKKIVDDTFEESSNKYHGFIAQDIKDIIPEAVHGSEDTNYSLDYKAITAFLVKAVQELSARIEALEA